MVSEWPQKADGEGYSLVTVYANPDVDAVLSTDWTASAESDGSPGKDDKSSIVSAFEVPILARNIEMMAYPNPMTNFVNFKVNNGETIKVVNLYNLSGVKVATLTNLHGGEITWNGRNEQGVSVEKGIYIYQALVGDTQLKSISGKIMKY